MTSKDPSFIGLIQAAENESRNLSERIVAAHRRIRSRGGYVGKKPFGYNKIRVDGIFVLQENRLEQIIMRKIREIHQVRSYNFEKLIAFAARKYPRYNWTIKMIMDCIEDTIPKRYKVIPATESGMDSMIEAIEEIEQPIDVNDIYLVKKIHKIRQHNGVYQMLVEWRGYSECTWENVVTLHEDIPDMVEEFLENNESAYVSEVRDLISL